MCNCSIYGLCSLWTMYPVYFVHPMFYILLYVNIVKAVQTDIYVDCKSIYCIPYMGIIFYKGWCLCPLILLVIFYLGPCEIRCIFMLTRIHQSWYGDGAGAGEYPYHPHPYHPLPPPPPYDPYLYHNTIKLVHLFLTPNIINCLELSYIM